MLRSWIRKHRRYLLAFVASALMIAWLVIPSLMSIMRRTEENRGTINGREVSASRMQEAAMTSQFLMQLVSDMQRLRMAMFQLRASPDALTQDQMQNLQVQFSTMAGLLQALDIRYQEILYLIKEDRQSQQLSQKEIWRYLVLLYEAEEAGINASPDEIDQRIQALQSLSEQDQVEFMLIQRMLGRLANRPGMLRVTLGHLIEVSKLVSFKLQNTPVTSPELWSQFRFRNDQAKVSFVEFRPEWFRSLIEPEEKELKEFYEAHKNTIPEPQAGTIGYKSPAKAKVACAVARFKDYRDQVEVTDEEIKTYYEENKSQFIKPQEEEQASGSEVAPQPSDLKEAIEGTETQEESGAAETQDKPNEEGAPLPTSQAQPEEEDKSTPEQGKEDGPQADEGAQADTDAEKQETDTAQGEEDTSEKEEKPEYKPLSKVRDQIKQTLIEQKAREAAMEAADKAVKDLKEASDDFINEALPLEQMARRYDLEYKVIADEQGDTFLSRDEIGQIVPQVRQLPGFALDGQLYFIRQFESNDGVRICQVLDRREPQTQPFETVRDRVLADYRMHKALDKAQDLAADLMKSAEQSSLQEAVAQMNTRLESLVPEEDQPKRTNEDTEGNDDGEESGDAEEQPEKEKKSGKILQIVQSDFFSRSNPRLSSMGGQRSKVVDKALNMDTGARATVVDGQNPRVCYLIEKLEHKAATAKDYHDQKTYLERSYAGQKRSRLLDTWMKKLVAASEMAPETEEKEDEEKQQQRERAAQRAGKL